MFNPFPSGFKQIAQKNVGSVYYIEKWGKTSTTEVVYAQAGYGLHL